MELPRGMRDFPPAQQIARDKVLRVLQDQFARFGFSPLATPVVERWEVLSAKYAGGEEILKEAFQLEDQGGRKLGLRYDLTVPLARFVAMNPDVKLPFKRYAIGTVYRDGPIKLGRYREFIQCDADIIGTDSALADAQCLQLAQAVFGELGLDVTLSCNDVSLVKYILAEEGVPKDKITRAMLTLDKLKKIGPDGVRKELGENDIPSEAVNGILAAASESGNRDKLSAIKAKYPDAPTSRVEEVLELAEAEYDPSLARGLAYYTGMVFEAYTDGEVTVAIAGGGRYDDMIGNFLGKGEYPAVGISFGIEPIMDALQQDEQQTLTRVFVIPIATVQESNALAQRLRSAGVTCDIDLTGRGVSKNLDYANALGIPYVVILGKKELAEDVVTLKDMASGEEQKLSEEELLERL